MEQLTINILRKLFYEFNSKFFDNKLPYIDLQIKRLKNQCGQYRYDWRRENGNYIEIPKCIIISNFYEYPMHDIAETLIHEMIHYYISYFKIKDNNDHGRVFQKMAKNIHNIDSNYTITTRYTGSTSNLKITKKCSNKIYYYATFEYHGKKCFTRVSKSFIDKYYKKFYTYFYEIKNFELYTTKNPEMERFENRSKNLSLIDINELPNIIDSCKLVM